MKLRENCVGELSSHLPWQKVNVQVLKLANQEIATKDIILKHSHVLKKKRNDEGLYGDGLGHLLRVSGVEEGRKETGGTFLPRTVAS